MAAEMTWHDGHAGQEIAWHDGYASQDMSGYDQEAYASCENWASVMPGNSWSSVMPGQTGGFDDTGAWVPYAQPDYDGGFYDASGAWVPSAARDLLRSSRDPRDEFEARAKAVLAKKQLQEAMRKVAPAPEPEQVTSERESVEATMEAAGYGVAADYALSYQTDLCWDLQHTGTCARGLACQWRHSLAESAEGAATRRFQVLSTLRAGKHGSAQSWTTSNQWSTMNHWPTRSRGATGVPKASASSAAAAPLKASEADLPLRPSRRPPAQVAVQRPSKDKLLERFNDQRTPDRVKDRPADNNSRSPEKAPGPQSGQMRRADSLTVDAASPSKQAIGGAQSDHMKDFATEVHSKASTPVPEIQTQPQEEVSKEQVVPIGGSSGTWQPQSKLPFSYADIVKTPPGFKPVKKCFEPPKRSGTAEASN